MSPSLDSLQQSLLNLKAQAETMPPGGDLESLIEEHLAVINRQCYEMCLSARPQPPLPAQADPSPTPEGFFPSGMSRVRDAATPRSDAPASGPDAARPGAL
jgi:hypothetical protein